MGKMKIDIRNMLRIFILMFFFIYFISIYINVIKINEWQQLQIPMILFVAYCTYSLIKAPNVLTLGANMMVFVYTVLSLLSLLILLPWFPNISTIRSQFTMKFLNYPELIDAVCISCAGIAVFVISTILFSKLPVNANQSAFGNGLEDLDDSNWNPNISYFSVVVLALSAGYIILRVISNPGVLTSGYAVYNSEMRSDNLFAYSVNLLAFSFIVLVTVCNKRIFKIGVIIFTFASIILLLLGNRGEVFYPLLAMVAVYTKRGGTIKKRTFIIGVIGSLLLISFIRMFRTVGLSKANLSEILSSFSPISAIAESIGEMGFQIGPTTYMLRYLEEGGYRFGRTVLYSFSNVYYKFLPFISQPDSSSPDSIKSIMPTDYYAFSSIAEAYYNFSLLGVVVFCVFLAWILTKNNSKQKNVYVEIASSMLIIALIQGVRNTTAVLPYYLLYIALMVVGAFVTRHILRVRK